MKGLISIFLSVLILALSFNSVGTSGSQVAVTDVYWFGENSTLLPVPGMVNAPLFVTIKNTGSTIYNFTAFMVLSFPFSYGFIINNGTKVKEKSIISLPEFPSGGTVTISQLVNISSEGGDGIYLENLYAYGSTTSGGVPVNLSTEFLIPLQGNIHLFVANSYIGINGNAINPLPGQNPVPYTIIIGNSGNSPATNVTLKFNPGYPFYGRNMTQTITAIPQYGYSQVTFMVNLYPNIKNGSYPEMIQISYYNVSITINYNFTWSYSIDFSVLGAYLVSQGFQAMGGMNSIPLLVDLMETGTSYVSNVSVRYTPSYPFYGNTQFKNITLIAPMQSITLPFYVSINNGTDDGIYYQNITVFWGSVVRVLQFQVYITGYSQFISTGSYFATGSLAPIAGMRDIPLNVIISNSGNAPATNVTFTYIPSYPLYGEKQILHIPIIPPYQPLTLTFIVSIYNGTKDGTYEQSIAYSFSGYSGNIKFSSLIDGYSEINIQGYVKNPPYVFTNQTFNSIRFSIINSGNSLAYNVSIYANSSLQIVNTPFTIPSLPPGIPINYTLYYNTPQTPGDYEITLHAGGGIIRVPVRVLSPPYIKVSDSIPALTPGESKVQITFYIQNEGPGNVQALQVHLVYPQVIDLHVSSSNPLGGLMLNNVTLTSLNENSSFTLVYIVDVADNAIPGHYTGELVFLLFLNNSVKPILETHTFTFSISSPFFSTGSSGLITLSNLTIFILLAVIIALVFLLFRARRKS
ncbi:MAG: hypothetical protein ACP5GE_05955 [Thermoplasmata archaeon]|jgi:hypothetical protein|nr:hypothetical protein [Thermoplasmatales archaeon]